MEHNAIQWLGAPSCQRGPFSFYKSVGTRTCPDGPLRTFRLGEFYFIRCGPQEPVCLAEVTLLWEDQTQRHPLASARLYYLPEDTPKGRTRDHGEDEVLAVSRKMVVKVEDLVRWSCLEEANRWTILSRTAPNGTCPDHGTPRPDSNMTDLDHATPKPEPNRMESDRATPKPEPNRTDSDHATPKPDSNRMDHDHWALRPDSNRTDLDHGIPKPDSDRTDSDHETLKSAPNGTGIDHKDSKPNSNGSGPTLEPLQSPPGGTDPDLQTCDVPQNELDPVHETRKPNGIHTVLEDLRDRDQTVVRTLELPADRTKDQNQGQEVNETSTEMKTEEAESETVEVGSGTVEAESQIVEAGLNAKEVQLNAKEVETKTVEAETKTVETETVETETVEAETVEAETETVEAETETVEAETETVEAETETVEAETKTVEVGLIAKEAETKTVEVGLIAKEAESKTVEAVTRTVEVGTKCLEAGTKCLEAETMTMEAGSKSVGVAIKSERTELRIELVELKTERLKLKKESSEDAAVDVADRETSGQWVKVLSYPQYCRFRSLQRRTQDWAAGPTLHDPHVLALGGLKVALSHTRVMFCRDTFNHPTLESNACFSWQLRCPSLSLRGRPRKRKGRDGVDSPTSSQSESWIDRMQENIMGSVESGCEGAWLPHPDEQFFLDQLFSFMDKQGAPIHKVPNLGFKKINLFLMYSVVKRLGGYEKVTNDRLWKVVYNELGGCPGSTSAATCTRRHYERLMLPYEEHLRAGGIEIRIPEFNMPPRPKGMRGRKPGRKPGPKPKDKKLTTPSAPRTIVNPDGTVVVKRGRGRPPGKKNKATLIAQAKLLAQQQAKSRPSAGENKTGLKPGPGRGRPPAHASLPRVPPLHAPQPIAPALIPVNMPLTPDLSPRSGPFLPFLPKTKDLKPERPQSSASNSASATNITTATTTVAPPQGLLLSALPHHFVTGFSPIKGLCPLDVFRNRIQRGLDGAALTPQDPSQHQLPTPAPTHQIVYSIQPKITESAPGLSQGPDAARSRLPLPPLRVLPLDLDCSVQVRQLMRTRLGSTQFQTFTRRLSEALSQDGASKPATCSPITPPPEQNLPLNLSKRLPATKRAHPDGPRDADPSAQEAKRQRAQEDLRPGHVGGQDPRVQEEPADLSSPSRIRAFLLGLPPFQVKLEEDLNGARFTRFSPDSRRAEAEGLGRKTTQDDDVIIVEDDRDDDEEQEAVVFVKEEFNSKEANGEKMKEDLEVLPPAAALVLAQHS